MSDATKLIKQAEALVTRLERLLPQEAPPADWKASVAFRWRKKNGKAYVEPVRHVHRIALRDLQGIDSQKIFTILNRAIGLEGATKAEAEAIIGLPIKTTLPYMGGNFALANNQNQPISIKYPTDTASIILKSLAVDMIKAAQRARASQTS